MFVVRGQISDYGDWWTTHEEEKPTYEEADELRDELEKNRLFDRVIVEEE